MDWIEAKLVKILIGILRQVFEEYNCHLILTKKVLLSAFVKNSYFNYLKVLEFLLNNMLTDYSRIPKDCWSKFQLEKQRTSLFIFLPGSPHDLLWIFPCFLKLLEVCNQILENSRINQCQCELDHWIHPWEPWQDLKCKKDDIRILYFGRNSDLKSRCELDSSFGSLTGNVCEGKLSNL